MIIKELNQIYPHLFQEVIWGSIRANFHVLEDTPPAELIANVNVVSFTNHKLLILQLDDGSWEIPTCHMFPLM